MNNFINTIFNFEQINTFLNKILLPVNKFIKIINEKIHLYGKSAGFISGLILILSGILLVFWGYRLKKLALTIIGFFIGAIIGFYSAGLIQDENNILPLILSLVIGICGAVLINFLYKAAIIIIGVLSGFSMGFFICGMFDFNTLITLTVSLLLGIIGAVLAIKIEKVMFIIITVYYGYLLFRIGINSINIFNIDKIWEEVISIAILILGIIFQFYEQLFINKEIIISEKSNSKTKGE